MEIKLGYYLITKTHPTFDKNILIRIYATTTTGEIIYWYYPFKEYDAKYSGYRFMFNDLINKNIIVPVSSLYCELFLKG